MGDSALCVRGFFFHIWSCLISATKIVWGFKETKHVLCKGTVFKRKVHLPTINLAPMDLPSWKLTHIPLKIDAWKMKCPVKMVPFQGDIIFFFGRVVLFPVTLWIWNSITYSKNPFKRRNFCFTKKRHGKEAPSHNLWGSVFWYLAPAHSNWRRRGLGLEIPHN